MLRVLWRQKLGATATVAVVLVYVPSAEPLPDLLCSVLKSRHQPGESSVLRQPCLLLTANIGCLVYIMNFCLYCAADQRLRGS